MKWDNTEMSEWKTGRINNNNNNNNPVTFIHVFSLISFNVV